MPILVKEEIIKPEKRYNKMWVRRIEIYTVNESISNASVTIVPYNDDNEFLEEGAVNLFFPDVCQSAVANPDSNIAKAMYFLLASVKEEYLKSGN